MGFSGGLRLKKGGLFFLLFKSLTDIARQTMPQTRVGLLFSLRHQRIGGQTIIRVHILRISQWFSLFGFD